jgi:pyruvate-ferredoxin/flavodoxin oxidoreductase
MLTKIDPERAKELLQEAQEDVNTRWQMYQYLAARKLQETQHQEPENKPVENPHPQPESNSNHKGVTTSNR